jgi:hypothetical protein
VLCGLLGLALARLDTAAADKARANTAADAAALAAADQLALGHASADAWRAARRTAADNGGELLSCNCAGPDVIVSVAWADARSRARAVVGSRRVQPG